MSLHGALLLILVGAPVPEGHIKLIVNIGMGIPAMGFDIGKDGKGPVLFNAHIPYDFSALTEPCHGPGVADHRHIAKADGLPPGTGRLEHAPRGNDDLHAPGKSPGQYLFRVVRNGNIIP